MSGKGGKDQTQSAATAPPAYIQPYLGEVAKRGIQQLDQPLPATAQAAIAQLGAPSQTINQAEGKVGELIRGNLNLGPVGGQYTQARGLQLAPMSYQPASLDELQAQIAALTRGVVPGVQSAQANIGGSGGAASQALIAREYGDAAARIMDAERNRMLTNQGQFLSDFGAARGLESQRQLAERGYQVGRYGDERQLTTNAALQAIGLAPQIADANAMRALQAGMLPYETNLDRLSQYASILGGLPFGTQSQQSQPTYRNRAAGAAGGALSGAAVGTSIMPGWGTAIGAVGGGLLGAFS